MTKINAPFTVALTTSSVIQQGDKVQKPSSELTIIHLRVRSHLAFVFAFVMHLVSIIFSGTVHTKRCQMPKNIANANANVWCEQALKKRLCYTGKKVVDSAKQHKL